MRYQGPNSFRRAVEKAYEDAKSALPRPDSPLIIVGAIGKIYQEPERSVIRGDPETNRRIDKSFDEFTGCSRRGLEELANMALARQRLLESCKEANILPEGDFGQYQNCLDAILLSPYKLVNYMIASRNTDAEVMAARNAGMFADHLIDKDFPHRFAHELVHWDFGETMIVRDIQRAYRELGIVFDKSKDGKFIFENAEDASAYREDARRAAEMGKEKNVRLSTLFAKLMGLGIYDFEEDVAELAATSIIRPATGLMVRDEKKMSPKLLSMSKIMGPRELIQFGKIKVDEAYSADRDVFSLI